MINWTNILTVSMKNPNNMLTRYLKMRSKFGEEMILSNRIKGHQINNLMQKCIQVLCPIKLRNSIMVNFLRALIFTSIRSIEWLIMQCIMYPSLKIKIIFVKAKVPITSNKFLQKLGRKRPKMIR